MLSITRTNDTLKYQAMLQMSSGKPASLLIQWGSAHKIYKTNFPGPRWSDNSCFRLAPNRIESPASFQGDRQNCKTPKDNIGTFQAQATTLPIYI